MTTATVKVGDAEDLEILKALAELENAPEPEPPDKVVLRGETRMVRTQTKSAEYVHLRNNFSGRLKLVNKNTLRQTLKLVINDDDCRKAGLPLGSKAYILPDVPWQGRAREPNMLCPLNPDHPDRPRMDLLNLGICTKRGKLMGPGAVKKHLMKKHKDDYDTIELNRQEQREDRRDEAAALTARSILKLAGGGAKKAKRGGKKVLA